MHCDCQTQNLASSHAFRKAQMKVTEFCGVCDITKTLYNWEKITLMLIITLGTLSSDFEDG